MPTGKVKTVEYDHNDGSPVTGLFFSRQWSQLFVATESSLHMLKIDNNGGIEWQRHEWVIVDGSIFEYPLTSFDFDPNYITAAAHDGSPMKTGALWLVQWGAVHRLDGTGRFDRFSYHQGNPFVANLTSVAVGAGQIWVASNGADAGAIASIDLNALPGNDDTLRISTRPQVCDSDAPDATPGHNDPWKWKLYQHNGFLPSPDVTELHFAGDSSASTGTVMATTSRGMALVDLQMYTFDEKAESCAMKQYPRHNADGLVSESYAVTGYGDFTEWSISVNDNHGLWTSMHGMSEAFAWKVTGNLDAKKRSWEAFEGLEKLSNLTGAYPNFPARSYCDANGYVQGCGTSDGEDRWHWSTMSGFENYMWKDDTSSDEIDGHLSAMPVIYDLVAETDEERERVYALIEGITGGILENDLYLIDPSTGKRTSWGFWNPKELNNMPEHSSERGLNSVEILSYFASAYSITKDTKYKTGFWNLITKHQYHYNAQNLKIDNPNDDNHSDNELLSLTWHCLFYAWRRVPDSDTELKAELFAMVEVLKPAAQRCFDIINAEFNPLWTATFGGAGPMSVTKTDIQRSIYFLQRYPLELTSWPVTLNQRADVEFSPYHVRDGTAPEVRQVLPPDARAVGRDNGDPFEASQGSGTTEFEPSVFRLPYYMMQFYNFM
jgi:hypothetical protein